MIRVVTSIVMILVTGLPVTAVLCARECGIAADAAVTASESHCHDADTGATTTLRSVAPDGCAILTLAEAAPRERTAALHRSAPVSVHLPHTLAGAVSLTSIGRADFRRSLAAVGLSPGVRIPLRI